MATLVAKHPNTSTGDRALGAASITSAASWTATAGNMIIAIVSSYISGESIPTVTFSDSKSNSGWSTVATSWIAVGTDIIRISIGRCLAIGTGGSGYTVTATASSGTPDWEMTVIEVSPSVGNSFFDALGGTNSGTDYEVSSPLTMNSGAVSPLGDSLVYVGGGGYLADVNGVTITLTWSGATELFAENNWIYVTSEAAYYISSGSQTYTCTVDPGQGTTSWAAAIAAFLEGALASAAISGTATDSITEADIV